MPGAIVIDDKGEILPLGGPRLRTIVNGPASDFEAIAYAVCNLGYVLLRPQGHAVRTQMRPALVKPATLIGLYYALVELRPRQILLVRLGADSGPHEIFDDLAEFAATVERAVGDEGARRHHPAYALTVRPLHQLQRPRYARLAVAAALWSAARGELPVDLLALLRRCGVRERFTLVRNPPGTGRLVYDHLGGGYSFTDNACLPLTLIGRDMELLPDQDYGDRVARSYHACLAAEEPRLETVSAVLRRSDGERVWTYYDRLVLPWRAADGTRCVLGVSEVRRRSLAA